MSKYSVKKVCNKWFFPFIVLLLVTAGCSNEAVTGEAPQVENTDGKVLVQILHLNHFPVKSALDEVEQMLRNYEDQVAIQYYTFDSTEGKALAEEKGLKGHTPIVIYVNGEMEFELDGKKVEFYSFPQGEGTPMMGDGGWSVSDLEKIIQLKTGEHS